MPPRVVLDTNVLLSALAFRHGRVAWLRPAWQAGRFVPLASRDTVSELIRVLNYPKFHLDLAEQEALLADFLPYAETVPVDPRPEGLPALRDADDRPFLALARAADADALVSGDDDLLAVRDEVLPLAILSPADFAAWLESRT